ncbi:MAG TPA: cytochrome c3 family protein [Azospira sp.]|nr:cytochrome c3 family protein [Azospira sp.]
MERKSTIAKLTGSLLRLVTVSALMLGAAGVSQQAVAGIANTKHNLGSTGSGPNVTSGTDEICVFCHTPHASDTTAPVPLWNKRLSTGASYQTYANLNSSSIDGEILAVGSVSMACLSCPDGTQAMDNIINAPGSGLYDATGGGTNGRAWTWTSGGEMMSGLAAIAKDTDGLKNDHPVGIQYCGGGVTTSAATGANCKDADFKGKATGTENDLKSATINSQVVWWVETGGNTTREKTDMQLYTRAFTGANGTGPSVECDSCHDPHTEANPTFLRVSNTGSGVCLSCHVK